MSKPFVLSAFKPVGGFAAKVAEFLRFVEIGDFAVISISLLRFAGGKLVLTADPVAVLCFASTEIPRKN